MEVKLNFTEEELAEIVSSIQNAPVGGFGRIDKNREVYSLPTKRLANMVAKKLNAALTEIAGSVDTNATNISKNAENITALQTGLSATNEKVQENEIDINGIRASVSFTLGKSIGLTLDDEYKLTAYLYNGAGSVISKQTVDFPVESVVVNAFYDNVTQQIVLLLQNGNYISFPVGDLVEGLISSTEKGQPNGVATLGADGKVPSEQLPAGQGGAPDLSEYVKFTDYAAENRAGVVKSAKSYAFVVTTIGAPSADILSLAEYKRATVSAFIGKGTLENIKYTYVKEGITTNTETLTDEEKTSACDWLGALKKLTEVTSRPQVYVKSEDGTQTLITLSTDYQADAVPKYNAGGRLTCADPTSAYNTVNKRYVDSLPDNLALTDDTQEEDGTVTEGTKTKWQKWLGIESGGGGGTKLYLHKFPVVAFGGDFNDIKFISFICTDNVKHILTNDYGEITLDYPQDIAGMIPNSFQVYYANGNKIPKTVLNLNQVTHLDFEIIVLHLTELKYQSIGISFSSMDDETYVITEL